MSTRKLVIGQIDYLNIWPIFHFLKHSPRFSTTGIKFVPGHPSRLNTFLKEGSIDMAPASLFEYLLNAELYNLLPNNGISAENEVQSVLFCTPLSGDELRGYVREKGRIALTSASATSVALLKILWKYAWNLPVPEWIITAPGQGKDTGLPFLEIGNFALETWLNPPSGYRIFDLAREWRKFTGLPFVFAVWIIRNELCPEKQYKIQKIHQDIEKTKSRLKLDLPGIVNKRPRGRFSSEQVLRYWQTMHYDLHPENLASIILFGKYCHQLGLIDGVPALSWQF